MQCLQEALEARQKSRALAVTQEEDTDAEVGFRRKRSSLQRLQETDIHLAFLTFVLLKGRVVGINLRGTGLACI